MTLASRVSLFFLGLLALTLTGFSTALYLLVAGYLDGQLNDRLEGALATLSAVVEVKKEGVEWELHGRRLNLGEGGVRWRVTAPEGRALESSPEPIPVELLEHPAVAQGNPCSRLAAGGPGGTWRISQTRFEPDARPGSKRDEPPEENVYPWLVVTAAVPTAAMDRSLGHLLGTLLALSVGVWGLAALLGRRLCQRTLAPVARMAESARSIPATEPGQRLAVAATGDELEELGRAFNGLLDRLQEAFERQRRFTGEASHQLRTPLTVLLGQVEVALRRERPPQEYRRVLRIVADQTGRLHRIVEMLLFLARADAEALSPERSGLTLGPWLRRHLDGWAAHPRAADLRLLDGAVDPEVQAHAPLLGQVVDILLDNACKYSPPGTPITLSVRCEGEHVLLSVEDDGGGVAPEDLPHIFEPFFRSPRLREGASGGVGLGLAIARRVTAALGGTVEVHSEPGRGSRFRVRLPAAPTRSSAAVPPLLSPPRPSPAPGEGGACP